MISEQAGTIGPYFPHAMTTNEIIPHLYVDVEVMRYRIPLKGAVKQGSPEEGRYRSIPAFCVAQQSTRSGPKVKSERGTR
ncbi:hypothetical protein V6N11_025557 [Hibiscus sabdariffa]|uniref:Uncharacterized protein n=2 Tax=Hibiscus sabdariffa TaxID=183260 RepID=A0ABR2N8P9_9ROSI